MAITRKLNILMIGSSLTGKTGGIVSVIKLLLNSKLAEEYNLIHLASNKKNNFFTKLLYLVYSFAVFPFYLAFGKIDLIHIHSSSGSSFFRKSYFVLTAKLFRKKVLFQIHSSGFKEFFEKSSSLVKNYIKFVLQSAEKLVVVSKKLAEDVRQANYELYPIVVYNPVIIREQITRPVREKATISFLGKLDKAKGVYEIIDAAEIIKNLDFIINLFGEGDVEEFQRLINQKGLEDKIIIKGWVDDSAKQKAYVDSDIIILPSYNEGLPLSVIEGMSYQLPLIATNVGGVPELLADNINGFLIPPGDSEALAEKLSILINDPGLRTSMGQAGYRIAKEKVDISIIVQDLKELYKVLSEPY